MARYMSPISNDSLINLCNEIQINDRIDGDDYTKYGVKRGLRNADGTGVMAGLTKICSVDGYYIEDGERVPRPGKLKFRGLNVKEIVEEIYSIAVKQNIKCVILEDIQYQQNPVLFKKLAMLQGVIRYWVINVLKIELITGMADEWRSYNHIYGTKRPVQKLAAIERARKIFKTEIPEDESESIFLGMYGVSQYYKNKTYKEEE